MKKEELVMTSPDFNYKLHGTVWSPDMPASAVKKVIHVVHGMTEHIGRYEEFAKAMTNAGIAVAGYDLRGHGRNFGDPECASFISGSSQKSNDYGWKRAVKDIKVQAGVIRKMFPHADYYLMGFSLGSFLVRDLLKNVEMNPMSGVILVGTGNQPTIVTAIMKLVIRGEIRKANVGGTTNVIRNLAFNTYNQKFAPNQTDMDWLLSDQAYLDLYLNDPLVRKDIAADLFYEMIACMQRVNGQHAYIGHNDLRKVPVLLLSGEQDAVGNMGCGVEQVAKQMATAGLRKVTVQLIPEARHDVLHEYGNGGANTTIQTIKNWLGV